MIKQLVLIFMGGGLGCALRFYFSIVFNSDQIKWLPTLGVNLFGCLFLGLLYGIHLKQGMSYHWYLILGTGFCGGLTTFSAFSLETLQLLKSQNYTGAAIYLAISISGGLLCAFAGYSAVKLL